LQSKLTSIKRNVGRNNPHCVVTINEDINEDLDEDLSLNDLNDIQSSTNSSSSFVLSLKYKEDYQRLIDKESSLELQEQSTITNESINSKKLIDDLIDDILNHRTTSHFNDHELSPNQPSESTSTTTQPTQSKLTETLINSLEDVSNDPIDFDVPDDDQIDNTSLSQNENNNESTKESPPLNEANKINCEKSTSLQQSNHVENEVMTANRIKVDSKSNLDNKQFDKLLNDDDSDIEVTVVSSNISNDMKRTKSNDVINTSTSDDENFDLNINFNDRPTTTPTTTPTTNCNDQPSTSHDRPTTSIDRPNSSQSVPWNYECDYEVYDVPSSDDESVKSIKSTSKKKSQPRKKIIKYRTKEFKIVLVNLTEELIELASRDAIKASHKIRDYEKQILKETSKEFENFNFDFKKMLTKPLTESVEDLKKRKKLEKQMNSINDFYNRFENSDEDYQSEEDETESNKEPIKRKRDSQLESDEEVIKYKSKKSKKYAIQSSSSDDDYSDFADFDSDPDIVNCKLTEEDESTTQTTNRKSRR